MSRFRASISLFVFLGSACCSLAASGGVGTITKAGQRDRGNRIPATSMFFFGLGDYDENGIVDLLDYAEWPACMAGPAQIPGSTACGVFDFDWGNDVDLFDLGKFQNVFGQQTGMVSDDCGGALSVGDGITKFSNLGATTDGPDEPEMCNLWGYSHIESDIWYCYTATCSGEVVASLCGSEYDTKMAVYAGCECPTEPPMVCNDDGCGIGFESRVTFEAVVGESYLIRIGGFRGPLGVSEGAGILTIRCGEVFCGSGNGDCFAANGTPGCDDVACCETTCAVDPYCCDVEWDGWCADESAGLCTGSFDICGTADGDCFLAGLNPGCENEECCNTVCMVDTPCCLIEWDALCANEAADMCLTTDTCGPGSGSCFVSNGTPGCDDLTCCEMMCIDDPFCCTTEWDVLCADEASTVCR